MRRSFRAEEADLRRELAGVRRALAELEAKSNRMRSALDRVTVGIVITDLDGRTLLRNAAATFGGHVAVLIDDVVQRLVPLARVDGAAQERLQLFGPPARVLLVRVVSLADECTIVTIDDLSERARLDSVRTDFVSNISHELKTPVGALAVLAETLQDVDDPEVGRRLAGKMVEEAHRAGRTIDDLLELSRIELGGPGERGDVDVAGVLHESVTRHQLTADSFGVQLVVEVPEGLVVRGDRLQLVSAVSNLVDNAVKYSNTGGVVTVRATSDDGAVEVSVADQGVGIPARDLDRIFERFYRVDRARSRQTGGTGLGLAIVRHVANNHSGDVAVRSREGEGSVFTLRIPMEVR